MARVSPSECASTEAAVIAMKRIFRDALRIARRCGYDAEIIRGSKHPKLKVTRHGGNWILSFSATPSDRDITIRNIERDLRIYCSKDLKSGKPNINEH